MYDSPAYVWAIIIAGPTAIAVTTCIALYGAGLGRSRTALLAGATAGLLGGWFTASAAGLGSWLLHRARPPPTSVRLANVAACVRPGSARAWP